MNKYTLTVLFAAVCSVSLSTLAEGNRVAGEKKAFDCETCHAPINLQMNPSWPALTGQNVDYLARQIRDFRAGVRKNGVMEQMVGNLTDEDVDDIAKYYAGLPVTTNGNADATNNNGKKLYTNGVASRGIPSCSSCHGVDGRSGEAGAFVLLAGQQKRYLENQLYAFKYGDRVNDVNGTMRAAVKQLDDDEIESISGYLSGLK